MKYLNPTGRLCIVGLVVDMGDRKWLGFCFRFLVETASEWAVEFETSHLPSPNWREVDRRIQFLRPKNLF
jgi:hypothetical protein